jgi:hypothetical protein
LFSRTGSFVRMMPKTGQALWEDRFDRAGGFDSPRPGAIAVSEGLLLVVGAAHTLLGGEPTSGRTRRRLPSTAARRICVSSWKIRHAITQRSVTDA